MPQHHHHLAHHLSHHLLPAHLQPELRLYELNKRLASRPEQPEAQAEGAWWEAFASEFFDEDATLSVRNVLDDNVAKNFTISRTLIPRFFRSICEGGVTDLHFGVARGGLTTVVGATRAG